MLHKGRTEGKRTRHSLSNIQDFWLGRNSGVKLSLAKLSGLKANLIINVVIDDDVGIAVCGVGGGHGGGCD